jgi:hypothetical protein
MSTARASLALIFPLTLGACAVAPPTGPTVFALPSKGKDMAQFQGEEANCRNYAAAQIGYGSPAQASNQAAVGSAVVGTALGAAAGALLGAAGGAAGTGAAVGAGAGLLTGSAIGASNAQISGASLQERYDVAYAQCMSSSGNTLAAPPAVPAYGMPYGYGYGYGYGYPSYWGPGYWGPGYWGPSVSFGFFGGRGWHGRGWGRRW